MPPISPQADLTIRTVMRRCGLHAAAMSQQGGFEVSEKGHQDYVTTIDTALDAELFATFSQLFPADGVITEENVRSRQQFHRPVDRLWCIDPLDGTEDLIQGRGNYAVMAGLLEQYQARAGWIYAPGRDRLYFGGSQWGLFQMAGDQAPIPLPVAHPSSRSQPLRMMIGHRDQSRYGAAIAQAIPGMQFQFMGSFGLKVLEVILGHADLYLYLNRRVKIWDTVGPLALAQAAGLTCCSLEGEPLRFTPAALELSTLAHRQAILIGHPALVATIRPQLVAAVHTLARP